MRKGKKKLKWEKPKLIALTRGKPEESVLSNCKHWDNPPIGGPFSFIWWCDEGNVPCGSCSSRTQFGS